MIERNPIGKWTEVTSLPIPDAMTKEQQIRVMIIPQLLYLASHLWGTEYPSGGRRLDKIVEELTAILDEGDELK
jgi:hypothetical protein